MTRIDSSLDREEFHEVFEQRDLVWILNRMREGAGEQLDIEVERFGKDVRQGIDNELMLDFGEPLDLTDWVVGYLTLIYEAENSTRVEQEVNNLKEGTAH